jgi:hypothetical protein
MAVEREWWGIWKNEGGSWKWADRVVVELIEELSDSG